VVGGTNVAVPIGAWRHLEANTLKVEGLIASVTDDTGAAVTWYVSKAVMTRGSFK
jgi:hypothetical protein